MPDELQDKGHHYTPGPAYTGGMPGMAGPMPGMAGPMPGMGGPMGGHVHPPCGPGPSHSPNNFLLGIESAKDLYDLDWTGKMDPYIKVHIGAREFRTPVMTNADKKPKFNWAQVVDWRGEPDIHFQVMDSNMMVADGFIGEAVYRGLPMQTDFRGTLELVRRHHFGGCRKAGKVKVMIEWQRAGMAGFGHHHGVAPMGAGMPGYGAGISPAAAGHMLLMGAYGMGGKKMKKYKGCSSSSSSSS